MVLTMLPTHQGARIISCTLRTDSVSRDEKGERQRDEYQGKRSCAHERQTKGEELLWEEQPTGALCNSYLLGVWGAGVLA